MLSSGPARSSWRPALRAGLGLLLPAAAAAAQCPDGTPPPCRPTTTALAVTRRANPSLNDNAWIVVPFGNAMQAQDLDWLRDASVNLLTLDLSRWTDVQVIDDKRVADLVRELPSGRPPQGLSLNDGLALARRAGAGKLVMGDYFRTGKGARVIANVFDVRTGAKLRTAIQETASADSILQVFGPLARSVLAVPPPPDAKLGSIGTTRTDAYQAYLLGVHALNRFDLTEATIDLKRALALDSTFALAHFKLSLAMAWVEVGGDSVEERFHAVAAARFGTLLPARERALIAARLAEENNDYGRACELTGALVAKDSADVEALYGLGECSYHDSRVIPSPNDPMIARFRGSWNIAMRSFTRVLQLDPNFHLAFNHILDMLTALGRGGCVAPEPDGWCSAFASVVLRGGDSLVTAAYNADSNAQMGETQRERALRDHSHLVNLREAVRLAQEWVDADPTEGRSHYYLAQSNLLLGNLPAAMAQSQLVAPHRDASLLRLVRFQRLEIALKLGHGNVARALVDSLAPAFSSEPSSLDLGALQAVFGHFDRWKAYRASWAPSPNAAGANWFYNVAPAMLGIPRDSLNLDERAYAAARAGPKCGDGCQRIAIFLTLIYAGRSPRAWWPVFPDTVVDKRMLVSQALARHDTIALRRGSYTLDSMAHAQVARGFPESGASVVATDGYLALHDSGAAYRMARFYVDTVMPGMPLGQMSGMREPTTPLLWVRMMLIRADLAMAGGQAAEARNWYARVLDLWADADAELQPTLSRIRAALARHGPGDLRP